MSSYFIYKEEISLKDLVLKAMKGDDESFGFLINSKKEDLYRIAYSYVHHQQDALDIVGDSVYKAYISIDKLKHPEYFNTWLVRIVINCSINFINKSKRILYLDNQTIDRFNDEQSNTLENIDLEEALQKLEPIYKTVIILRYSQDLKLKEIAEILELPLNTVKTRLYKAIGIFTLSINISPSFANTLQEVPVLGTLVKILQFNNGSSQGGELTDGIDINFISLKEGQDLDTINVNFKGFEEETQEIGTGSYEKGEEFESTFKDSIKLYSEERTLNDIPENINKKDFKIIIKSFLFTNYLLNYI